jgi:hypothetical protein
MSDAASRKFEQFRAGRVVPRIEQVYREALGG